MASPAPPAPPALSSHDRILQAAKHLFATRGYENTSTIMIARQAGTSESQLVKHFGSKDGLLEAIFEHGWAAMGYVFTLVDEAPTPVEKLRRLLHGTLEALERDPAMKEIMLLEARRIRKEGRMVLMTHSFLEFMQRLDGILMEMRDCGQLRPELRPEALRSALIGMGEGMLRDQLLDRRLGQPTYTTAELRRIFDVIVPALQPDPAKG
jgi:AcrR family transcriptional regulator